MRLSRQHLLGIATAVALPALAAAGHGVFRFDASAQMRARPMTPLLDGLRQLGAQIDGDSLPYTLTASGLQGGALTLPRSYIYARRITPADTFGPFSRMIKADPAWRYFEIDASHSPNVTAPEALMGLLEKIAG